MPPPIGARGALVAAGCALASAGEPADRYRGPWRRAGELMGDFFAWQAERYHYVAPSYADLYILAAAFLAGDEAGALAALRRHPLKVEKGVPARHAFFQKLVLDGFTGAVIPTDAERDDLARYASLGALATMFENASARDGAAFAASLADWLRTDWAKTDRAMRKDRLPYPGPISPVPCALSARFAQTPPLPGDIARFVDERPIAAARRLRTSSVTPPETGSGGVVLS